MAQLPAPIPHRPDSGGDGLGKRGLGPPLAGFTSSCAAPVAGHARDTAIPPPEPEPEPEPPVTQLSLADLVHYLHRHWKLALLCALPVAALVYAALGLGEKVYEAEARLLLRLPEASGQNPADASSRAAAQLSAPQLLNNHCAELQGRAYLEHLYQALPTAQRQAYLAARPPQTPPWLAFLHPAPAAATPAAPSSVTSVSSVSSVSPATPTTSVPPTGSATPTPPPATSTTPSNPPEEAFIKKLSAATRVRPLRDSHILRILIRDPDPAVAARLANAYAQQYLAFTGQQERSVTQADSERLRQKAEELRRRLDESEQKLASYRQSENLTTGADGREVSAQQIKYLTQTLAGAQVQETSAQQNLESLTQAIAARQDLLQLRLVGDNPDVAAAHQRVEAAEAELAEQRRNHNAKHPVVVALNQKLIAQRKLLQQNIDDVVARTTQEAGRAHREVADLRHQLEKARAAAQAQDDKDAQQNLLREELVSDRQNYRDIEARLTQASLSGDSKESGPLRVSDLAIAPDRPVKPSPTLAAVASLMAFGLVFLGLPLGCGLCQDHLFPLWRAEAASGGRRGAALGAPTTTALSIPAAAGDLTLHPVLAQSPGAGYTAVPPIAAIPAVSAAGGAPSLALGPGDPDDSALGVSSLALSPGDLDDSALGLPSLAVGPGELSDPALGLPGPCPVLLQLPEFPLATPTEILSTLLSSQASTDSILGHLCYALLGQPAPRAGPRVLLILSAERYEGKTLLATTVAAYLAMHRCRTLLMDCHPEAPAIHRWIPLPAGHSSGAHQLSELQYANSPLYVLPGHDLPSYDFSELVSGYAAWIGRAQGQVDWIVIDGPPVLRSYAEALQLLPLATDIVMVHDAARTPEAKMKASLNLLHPRIDPTLLRGVVLNRQRA